MSIFDFPTRGASVNDVIEEMRRVREYIRLAHDPNEAGENGETLLSIALHLCSSREGEALVAELLQRGADPNRPSPVANFVGLVTASNSLRLVEGFLKGGLRLNDVYEISKADGVLVEGPSTLLDFLDAIRDRISPSRRALNALAKKHVGGLEKRRRFIDQSIALLESHGAKRLKEIQQQ